MCFQSFFMLITVQPFFFASSYRAGVTAPTLLLGRPCAGTVGVLAHGVVVQHKHVPTARPPGPCVLQHLAVAGRVAKRRIGAPNEVNFFGLPALLPLLWFKMSFGSLVRNGLPIAALR